MPKEYSPFTPGVPVSAEFFQGRSREVARLRHLAAAAAARGRVQTAFLAGERGIGKSSLAAFVRLAAERDHRVLGVHTFLGGVSTLEEMARRVFDRLLKESIGKTWQSKVREFFGQHVRQVGLFGINVEFGAPETDLRRMVHDFAPALRNLMARLQEEQAGLLLVFDDINGLAVSVEFANWLKSLVDEIGTTPEPLPLCLVLVGLEERRQSLVSLQPSLARVFEIIEIQTWTDAETRGFFQDSFAKVAAPVDERALDIFSKFAGGLPVLAHEIGDAALKRDSDGRIDESDALNGVADAAEIVGRKLLEPRVFQAIRSARYRKILRRVVTPPFDLRFRRADLIRGLAADERKVLDNFLSRMKGLDVIRPDPDGGPGAYRFGNHLHYLSFRLEAERARKTRDV
ncbi:MAG: AAA family ATPase [Planctomycetes bacterium]|nr:AAA family ATPase [Planctomycetota bacterium]